MHRLIPRSPEEEEEKEKPRTYVVDEGGKEQGREGLPPSPLLRPVIDGFPGKREGRRRLSLDGSILQRKSVQRTLCAMTTPYGSVAGQAMPSLVNHRKKDQGGWLGNKRSHGA